MAYDLDLVAANIATNGDVPDVVAFCGFLGDADEADMLRLYLHPWFIEWVEFKKDDIVYQIKGEDRDDGGRSAVWIRATAKMKWCEKATAHRFAERWVRQQDDPGADGPSRPRRP